MNKAIFFMLLVVSIGMTPAFAQFSDLKQPVVINVDKDTYTDNEILKINGEVRNFYSEAPLIIKVVAPNDNLVYLDQIKVDINKKFNTEIKLGGNLMKVPGEYDVIAHYSYGDKNTAGMTSFLFNVVVEEPVEDRPIPKSGSIDIEGFTINYNISNDGELINVTPNQFANSLMLDINTDKSGSIVISIPRGVLNAINANGDDTRFIILDGDKSLAFEEVDSNASTRTISIEYSANTNQIEIIGTYAIPEFGAVVFMVMAVAIVAIIGLTYNNNLKFF